MKYKFASLDINRVYKDQRGCYVHEGHIQYFESDTDKEILAKINVTVSPGRMQEYEENTLHSKICEILRGIPVDGRDIYKIEIN